MSIAAGPTAALFFVCALVSQTRFAFATCPCRKNIEAGPPPSCSSDPASHTWRSPSPSPTKDVSGDTDAWAVRANGVMEAARLLQAGVAIGALASVVLIAPGTMRLGAGSQHFPNDAEGPQFTFTLSRPLWMDAHEVSNARFAQFVAATGHVTEAETFGWSFVHEDALTPATAAMVTQVVATSPWWLPVPNASWRHPEGEISTIHWRMDHPVVHVSQRDAAAFCRWAGLLDEAGAASNSAGDQAGTSTANNAGRRTSASAIAPAVGSSVGRLPSEDEWEFAARGGGDALNPEAAFPWGDDDQPGGVPASQAQQAQQVSDRQPTYRANVWQGGSFPHGNSAEDGYPWAAPVHAYGPQNALGLYNMAGNVWEWTASPWCGQALSAAASASFSASAALLAAGQAGGTAERAAKKAGMDWRPSARGSEAASCSRLQMPLPPPHLHQAADEAPAPASARRELAFYNSRAQAVRAAHEGLAADPGQIEYTKKGGSFMCARSHCYRYRSAARDKNTADSSAYNLGFRCVYDALPPWARAQA